MSILSNLPKLHLQKLAGDASTREYFRIDDNEKSFILLKDKPFDKNSYSFITVQRYFDEAGVRVPQLYEFNEKEGLLLLEDLGDVMLEATPTESFYKKSIDELIKIQKSVARSNFSLRFDVEKLMWELNFMTEHYLKTYSKVEKSPSAWGKLNTVFLEICTILDKEPTVVTHRDYHCRNLMIKDEKVVVIDFQDARLGPAQYDLVSLLKDSYHVFTDSERRAHMDYYLSHFEKVDRNHFEMIFDLMSIQRNLKAIGSFASFYNTKQNSFYLKFLPATLMYVRETVKRYPQYKIILDFIL